MIHRRRGPSRCRMRTGPGPVPCPGARPWPGIRALAQRVRAVRPGAARQARSLHLRRVGSLPRVEVGSTPLPPMSRTGPDRRPRPGTVRAGRARSRLREPGFLDGCWRASPVTGQWNKARLAMRLSQYRVVANARQGSPRLRNRRIVRGIDAVLPIGRAVVLPVFDALQRRIATQECGGRPEERGRKPCQASGGCSFFVCRIAGALDWHLPRGHVGDQNAAAHASGTPSRRRCGPSLPTGMRSGCENSGQKGPAGAVDGSTGRAAGAGPVSSGKKAVQGCFADDGSASSRARLRGWPQEAGQGRSGENVRGERHRGRA